MGRISTRGHPRSQREARRLKASVQSTDFSRAFIKEREPTEVGTPNSVKSRHYFCCRAIDTGKLVGYKTTHARRRAKDYENTAHARRLSSSCPSSWAYEQRAGDCDARSQSDRRGNANHKRIFGPAARY